jgi:hypothetical protein
LCIQDPALPAWKSLKIGVGTGCPFDYNDCHTERPIEAMLIASEYLFTNKFTAESNIKATIKDTLKVYLESRAKSVNKRIEDIVKDIREVKDFSKQRQEKLIEELVGIVTEYRMEFPPL